MLRKESFNKRKKIREKSVEIADSVIVKKAKTMTNPLFDQSPYQEVNLSRNQATLERGGQKLNQI